MYCNPITLEELRDWAESDKNYTTCKLCIVSVLRTLLSPAASNEMIDEIEPLLLDIYSAGYGKGYITTVNENYPKRKD